MRAGIGRRTVETCILCEIVRYDSRLAGSEGVMSYVSYDMSLSSLFKSRRSSADFIQRLGLALEKSFSTSSAMTGHGKNSALRHPTDFLIVEWGIFSCTR